MLRLLQLLRMVSSKTKLKILNKVTCPSFYPEDIYTADMLISSSLTSVRI